MLLLVLFFWLVLHSFFGKLSQADTFPEMIDAVFTAGIVAMILLFLMIYASRAMAKQTLTKE